MIGRPTTEQILLDCARELMEGVLPAITDQTTIMRIAMIDQVLRNAAIRSAHEIAWMSEEIPTLAAYARAVLDVAPRDDLAALLHQFDEADGRLHLDDVTERYYQASELLAAALEITVCDGHADLQRQGEQLIETRLAREKEVLAGWSPTGR